MRYRLFKFTLPTLIVFFCSPLVMAQPKVDDVAYEGQEIIITGSGFGNGPHVVLFENFEDGDKYSDQLENKSSSWADSMVVFKEASGNRAHRARHPIKGNMAQIAVDFGKDYTEAFLSFSVKVPEGTTFPDAKTPRTFSGSSSWKFTWLMSDADGYKSRNKFDMCLPTHTGGGIFMLAGNDGNMDRLEKGFNWWDWDGYNHMTSYIRLSHLLPTTYSWSVTNSKTNLDKTGVTLPTLFSETNGSFNRINIPGWWRESENDKFDGLYDNLYVAVGENALARVVITDNPNYFRSTVNLTLLPKTWDVNRITLDSGVIPTDQTYYFHIFDKNGRRAVQSLRVCPKCPKPLLQ